MTTFFSMRHAGFAFPCGSLSWLSAFVFFTHCLFSAEFRRAELGTRHAKADASIALVLWLNENVVIVVKVVSLKISSCFLNTKALPFDNKNKKSCDFILYCAHLFVPLALLKALRFGYARKKNKLFFLRISKLNSTFAGIILSKQL